MEHDEIIRLESGTEITIEAAMADLQRAAKFLAQIPDDDAQGLAADLNTATDLLLYLADRMTTDAAA